MDPRLTRLLALTASGAVATSGAVLLAAPASGVPAPRAQAVASASPSTSASASASASPSASAPPSGSASPRPSSTASPVTGAPSECTVATTGSLDPGVVVAGRPAQVTVTSTPGSTVRLFAHSAPSTSYFVAREQTAPADGRLVFTVTPPTNTSLYAEQDGCDPTETLSLGVRTDVGISALRNGRRDYTFSGGTLPRRADRLVSLYRVTGTGGQVLTSQARTDAAGRWSVRRVFTGAGRFGFVARTGADGTNLAGSSRVRPTLVY